ncbi:hypothetical protein [Sphingobium indicum]|nr:hypothetical protein [Sphingobium indicum]
MSASANWQPGARQRCDVSGSADQQATPLKELNIAMNQAEGVQHTAANIEQPAAAPVALRPDADICARSSMVS